MIRFPFVKIMYEIYIFCYFFYEIYVILKPVELSNQVKFKRFNCYYLTVITTNFVILTA